MVKFFCVADLDPPKHVANSGAISEQHGLRRIEVVFLIAQFLAFTIEVVAVAADRKPFFVGACD